AQASAGLSGIRSAQSKAIAKGAIEAGIIAVCGDIFGEHAADRACRFLRDIHEFNGHEFNG
ncbi:MAG: hypothetical protein WA879_08565, partial [Candidatus Acidiferrales bacterium]